jgi:hypothetical protein
MVLPEQMPNSAAPKLKQFARRLLAHEAALDDDASTHDPAALRVCERLQGTLIRLMGVGGFRSLFSRALTQAGEEVPWLRALHIKADGSLEGLDELEAKLHPGVVADGEVVLVWRLVELLATFIGSPLTLRLLRNIWPKMDDLNF